MKKILGMIAAAMLVLPIGTEAATSWLREEILERNPLREGANFNVAANNTNRAAQEGLFSIPDEFGTAHFFRGTHELNNNVIFAGHQWKILRIEGNGNIRLIYNGECPNNDCDINGNDVGLRATIGRTSFNDGFGCHGYFGYDSWLEDCEWTGGGPDTRFVGYMHGTICDTYENCHKNTHDSTIKTFVDNWFNTSITGQDRTKVIGNTPFCADRSFPTRDIPGFWSMEDISNLGGPIGTRLVSTVYGAGSRLGVVNDVQPTLICPRVEDRLTMPVGLITADELALAGFRRNIINTDMFLANGIRAEYEDGLWYLGSFGHYWTMSPSAQHPTGGAQVFLFNTSEIHGESRHVSQELGVRPVLSLNGDVTVTGDGSSENPFIVLGMEERPEEENNTNNDNEVGTETPPTNNPQTSVSGVLAYGMFAVGSVSGIAALHRNKNKKNKKQNLF